MDSKLTLSFNQEVIKKAKKFADENNISLSRLVENLLTQVTEGDVKSLSAYPINDWVFMVAEGEVEYKRTPKPNRKEAKEEYFSSKK